jgi:competence protein ComEC
MNRKLLLLFCLICMDLAMLHDLWKIKPELQVEILNVGQGDSILLISPDQHHVLIDGGPGNSVLSELSEVLPESFREIDLMILTHPHLDHIEGLIPVLERFDVKAVMMSAPAYDSMVYDAFLKAVNAEGAILYFADAEVDFRLGSLTLDTLYPFEPVTNKTMKNVNNASPVIKVNDCLLLTGDSELEAEAEILEAGIDLDADILKAGHHGSRTSSSWDFLEAVSPSLMLISAGIDNSYGHPHEETLEKASDLGIEIRRTDLEGRLSLNPLDFCTQAT